MGNDNVFRRPDNIMMNKNLTLAILALSLSLGTTTLVGCGDDRPVATYDNAGGDGGTGGNETGTGGTTSDGGTGGGTVGTTGSNWAFYSFDVFKGDPYNTYEWTDNEANTAVACFTDSTCRAKMNANDPSQRFQFLGDGDYSESFSKNMGCFAFLRDVTSCGRKFTVKSGTAGVCWGTVKLSDSSKGNTTQHFKSSSISFGWESGDECAPGVIIACCENAITVTAYNP